MRTREQRNKINNYLGSKGLATLDDPRALIDQLGFLIRDDAAFRSLLLRLEPAERAQCYESLKNQLKFTAKPLREYEIEGAQIAEREQWPRWDPDNENLSARLTAYTPPSIGLDKVAEDAIQRGDSKTALELVCGRCGASAMFYGHDPLFPVAHAINLEGGDRFAAIKQAREAGWLYQMKRTRVDGEIKIEYREVCPECAKV